ncbi:STAS domain-containing protein [Polyangium sp. 6x1]|uniref:STAS domain-containing protein n=1 Tax=Polyangium sp. 6x1 TaxID=3042689 RepID=UPI002482B2DD|nr:STAS domain-containing protein [Polyangium sp. 6x1]MDI1447002.1 STAS domain-containing protein [Polyangium sp. 6x1]
MDDTTERPDERPWGLHEEVGHVRRALAEREQELSCLVALDDLVRLDTVPGGEICQRMVDLVPLTFLEGEPVAARVSLGDQDFATRTFHEGRGGHVTRILNGDQEIGALTVHRVEGPAVASLLSPQKRRFLALVAKRFGEVVQRRLAVEQQAELAGKLALIERQQEVIRFLTVPIIEVWKGVLLVSLNGVVDSMRFAQVTENTLDTIVNKQPYFVLLDLTGVDVIDTSTGNFFMRLLQCIRLMGVTGMLTGAQPMVVHTLMDMEFPSEHMRATLRDALQECVRQMRRQ